MLLVSRQKDGLRFFLTLQIVSLKVGCLFFYILFPKYAQ